MGGVLLLSLHEVVGLLVGSVDAGHVENSLQQKIGRTCYLGTPDKIRLALTIQIES